MYYQSIENALKLLNWISHTAANTCIILLTLMTQTHSVSQSSLEWTTAQRSHSDKRRETTVPQGRNHWKCFNPSVFFTIDRVGYVWLLTGFRFCSVNQEKFLCVGLNGRISVFKMRNCSSLNCNTEYMKQLMGNLGQQSIAKIISNEKQAIPTQYLSLHCLTMPDAHHLNKVTGTVTTAAIRHSEYHARLHLQLWTTDML